MLERYFLCPGDSGTTEEISTEDELLSLRQKTLVETVQHKQEMADKASKNGR